MAKPKTLAKKAEKLAEFLATARSLPPLPTTVMATAKPPRKTTKVKVALKDLNRVCEACGKVDSTVASHNYTTENYKGSCGDSFCYASCTLSSCKPITARVCASCFKDKAVPIAD